MKIEELLDLTLKEILGTYCAVYNIECGYYWGIFKFDDIEQLFEKYNIKQDYPEAFEVMSIIPEELIVSFQEDIGDYSKLEKIMKDLGITEKNEGE